MCYRFGAASGNPSFLACATSAASMVSAAVSSTKVENLSSQSRHSGRHRTVTSADLDCDGFGFGPGLLLPDFFGGSATAKVPSILAIPSQSYHDTQSVTLAIIPPDIHMTSRLA
jgi:hypothetical protein